MSKRELLKYLLENNTNISPIEVALSLAIAIILAFFIYFVYKKTYTGVMYSKNFNVTLVLICLITTIVMMIIGSNLALSLGMVGALSIIRFRTAVKDTKDSAFIFWAIAVGISCGAEVFLVGIIGSLVIAIVLIILKNGAADDSTYLLIIHGSKELQPDKVMEIVKNNTTKYYLKMKNITSSTVDITYEIKFKKNTESKIVDEINELSGCNSVNIVTYNGEIAG